MFINHKYLIFNGLYNFVISLFVVTTGNFKDTQPL